MVRQREAADQGHWEARLSRLAATAEASRALYEDDRAARDEAVTEAIDSGFTVAQVARWSLMSTTRVIQILARGG